jgi:hypothetical protein
VVADNSTKGPNLGLKIFFDVDYTLLSMDGSLRPMTRQTFEKLIGDGHQVFIWSGVGDRTADVKRHELQDLVSGVYKKPIYDFVHGLELLKVPHWPDFVIDDYPDIVDTFGGVLARPYFFRSQDDDEMEHIYSIIEDFVSTGTSDRVGYRAARGKRPH